MKIILVLVSLLVAMEPVQVEAAPTKSGIAWNTSLKSAFGLAKAQHKLVIADIYTDTCFWCKRLDAEVFANPGVVKEMANKYIWVKLNAKSDLVKSELRSYSISGYPTILLLDHKGGLKSTISGYVPPEEFYEKIDMATLRAK
jgi:thioredoxin-related protein